MTCFFRSWLIGRTREPLSPTTIEHFRGSWRSKVPLFLVRISISVAPERYFSSARTYFPYIRHIPRVGRDLCNNLNNAESLLVISPVKYCTPLAFVWVSSMLGKLRVAASVEIMNCPSARTLQSWLPFLWPLVPCQKRPTRFNQTESQPASAAARQRHLFGAASTSCLV